MTPEQIKRRNKIFTAEKIIEISKGLSNEKNQELFISELQDKIDSLKVVISKSHSNSVAFSNMVSKLREELEDISNQKDDKYDEVIELERNKRNGIHSYAGIKLQEFDFKKINFYINISYNFGFLKAGLYSETFSLENNNILSTKDYNLKIFYGIFLEYKIF